MVFFYSPMYPPCSPLLPFLWKSREIPTDEKLREIWGDLRRNEQGWEYPKVQGYGRVENQAGERVGVAKAPRLGSQQTAEPTAFGDFCEYGQKYNCGSFF